MALIWAHDSPVSRRSSAAHWSCTIVYDDPAMSTWCECRVCNPPMVCDNTVCHLSLVWQVGSMGGWMGSHHSYEPHPLPHLAELVHQLCYHSYLKRRYFLKCSVTALYLEGCTEIFSLYVISWFFFSVKREFSKVFFVTRDLKVLRDPWPVKNFLV